MIKLVWMSDLHFAQQGYVQGHDPHARLQMAIDHINRHHGDAQMCVISGDLVNRGTATDYAGLAARLKTLNLPVLPMVGNHDARDLLRQSLPITQLAMSDFVQYQITTPHGLILCLDTQKTGSDAGTFCTARMAWLADRLRAAKETPTYIFMHHPPMPLDLPMQDSDRMENGQDFLDLLADFDCVRYLFLGHVHRPITGTIRGIPFATMRAVLYQAPPPRPTWDWSTFQPAAEAPNIGIVYLADGAVTLHYDQFCASHAGVDTGSAVDPLAGETG